MSVIIENNILISLTYGHSIILKRTIATKDINLIPLRKDTLKESLMAPCVYTNEDNILYTKDMENMKINNIFINSNTFSYYITILNSFLTFFLVIHLHFHNVYFLKTLITTNNVMEKGLALVPVPVTIAVKNLT